MLSEPLAPGGSDFSLCDDPLSTLPEFQSRSLCPPRILKPYCPEENRETILDGVEGRWQQNPGVRRCTPQTNNVICTFHHDPVTPRGQRRPSRRAGAVSGRPPFSCVQHNQVGNFINTSRLRWSGRDRFSDEAAGGDEEGEEEAEDEERTV